MYSHFSLKTMLMALSSLIIYLNNPVIASSIGDDEEWTVVMGKREAQQSRLFQKQRAYDDYLTWLETPLPVEEKVRTSRKRKPIIETPEPQPFELREEASIAKIIQAEISAEIDEQEAYGPPTLYNRLAHSELKPSHEWQIVRSKNQVRKDRLAQQRAHQIFVLNASVKLLDSMAGTHSNQKSYDSLSEQLVLLSAQELQMLAIDWHSAYQEHTFKLTLPETHYLLSSYLAWSETKRFNRLSLVFSALDPYVTDYPLFADIMKTLSAKGVSKLFIKFVDLEPKKLEEILRLSSRLGYNDDVCSGANVMDCIAAWDLEHSSFVRTFRTHKDIVAFLRRSTVAEKRALKGAFDRLDPSQYENLRAILHELNFQDLHEVVKLLGHYDADKMSLMANILFSHPKNPTIDGCWNPSVWNYPADSAYLNRVIDSVEPMQQKRFASLLLDMIDQGGGLPDQGYFQAFESWGTKEFFQDVALSYTFGCTFMGIRTNNDYLEEASDPFGSDMEIMSEDSSDDNYEEMEPRPINEWLPKIPEVVRF